LFPQEIARRLWEKGLDYGEALDALIDYDADKELQAHLDGLKPQEREKVLENRFAYSELSRSFQDRKPHMLRSMLISGEMISFGFEDPRRLSDPPIRLPADLWKEVDRVFPGELYSEGLLFVGVRFISPDALKAITESHGPKRRGRPSRQHHILEAWADLEAGFTSEQTRRDAYLSLREWITKRYPEAGNKGLSNQTILKVLGSRLDVLKTK
jgi:hypothetical protein